MPCDQQRADESDSAAEKTSTPIDGPPSVVVADSSIPEASVDAAVPDAADAAPVGLRVFLSSTTSNGDFAGIAGGDAVCQNLATAASLGGKWVAWLSNEDGPAAINRVTSTGPWRLVTGEVVVASKAALVSGALQHAIDKDEKGVAVAAGGVWTGTGLAARAGAGAEFTGGDAGEALSRAARSPAALRCSSVGSRTSMSTARDGRSGGATSE